MKIAFLLLLLLPPLAQAGPTVLIEYRDKPPYSYTENGQPKGFLLERTQEIFRLAKLPISFAEIPTKRLVADLQANRQLICSPGWYKLPERYLMCSKQLDQATLDRINAAIRSLAPGLNP